MDSETSQDWTLFGDRSDDDRCENCGSLQDVRKFEGSLLCPSCRNQWAAMK